jgi:hypothetical protein
MWVYIYIGALGRVFRQILLFRSISTTPPVRHTGGLSLTLLRTKFFRFNFEKI